MGLHEQLADRLTPGVLRSGILQQPITLRLRERPGFEQLDTECFVSFADGGDLLLEGFDSGGPRSREMGSLKPGQQILSGHFGRLLERLQQGKLLIGHRLQRTSRGGLSHEFDDALLLLFQ